MKDTPAFPTVMPGFCTEGMTLRDWFAGMAMLGMCANPDLTKAMSEEGMKPWEVRRSFAESAYAQALDMVAERERI